MYFPRGNHFVVVISPLLALMNNQVAALEAANIPVATLNSNTLFGDRDKIIKDLCCGHPRTRLLYITPEYTLSESFRRCLQTIYTQGELARIAIDEAHCISEWGHDFRRAYAHLSHFRTTYPSVPIICLTATATPFVRASIISTLALNLSNLRSFCMTTSRPNLHYEIRFTSDQSDTRFHELLTWLTAIHARRATNPARKLELKSSNIRPDAFSGIIYVPFRTDCETLAGRLRTQSIGAAPYHAGLSTADRALCQQKWIVNAPGYDIIVATTAFGMGIDKQDVRFVVHWSVPKSFEGYYQEAGRAGRDGKAAVCMLFYSREDRDRVAWRISKDGAGSSGEGNNNSNSDKNQNAQIQSRAASFQKLVSYCEEVRKCRHVIISEFFDELEPPTCDYACDFCKDPAGLRARKAAGLASEEWVSTQRDREDFYGGGYD